MVYYNCITQLQEGPRNINHVKNHSKFRSQFPHNLCTYYFILVQRDDELLDRNTSLK